MKYTSTSTTLQTTPNRPMLVGLVSTCVMDWVKLKRLSSNRHGTPNHILNTLTVVKFITKFVAIRLIKLENWVTFHGQIQDYNKSAPLEMGFPYEMKEYWKKKPLVRQIYKNLILFEKPYLGMGFVIPYIKRKTKKDYRNGNVQKQHQPFKLACSTPTQRIFLGKDISW